MHLFFVLALVLVLAISRSSSFESLLLGLVQSNHVCQVLQCDRTLLGIGEATEGILSRGRWSISVLNSAGRVLVRQESDRQFLGAMVQSDSLLEFQALSNETLHHWHVSLLGCAVQLDHVHEAPFG